MFLAKGVFILAALCVVFSLPIDDTHRVRRYTFGSGSFGGGFGSYGGGFGSSSGGFGSSGSSFGSYGGGFGSSGRGYGSSGLSLTPSFNIQPAPNPFAIKPIAEFNTSPLGTYQKAGINSGPFSASVSQSFDRFGKSSPQTFSLDGDFKKPDTGSGISLGVSKTPSFGGTASVGGSLNLHHTDTSNLNAVGKHTEHFDNNWSSVGKTDSVGLEFKNTEKGLTVGVGVQQTDPKFGKPSTDAVLSVGKTF